MSPAPELPCAPESYALRTGEAHVWRVRLASTLGETGEMRALLSDAERGRGERFAFERDQARFISCRAALRVLLGRYTGIAPKRVHFRYGTHGKPALDGAARRLYPTCLSAAGAV